MLGMHQTSEVCLAPNSQSASQSAWLWHWSIAARFLAKNLQNFGNFGRYVQVVKSRPHIIPMIIFSASELYCRDAALACAAELVH